MLVAMMTATLSAESETKSSRDSDLFSLHFFVDFYNFNSVLMLQLGKMVEAEKSLSSCGILYTAKVIIN